MNEISTGTVIGRKYRVLGLIGSGGMANVYKAVNNANHKIVAIKVLKDEYASDAEFRRRFNSEAQAVLNLSHDNIVKSMDVGEEDGINYIVLEYVEGRTLKQVIREEAPLDDKRIISIATQLCDGLAHAHERNIIHRDVKPQNVIINERGRAKIADFGIARFTDASTLTFTGDKVLGSVHYVSPEQARGERVSASSDIYSLGVVMYEMATGQVPFDSDNTVSVAIKHLEEEMPSPRDKNPNLSVALSAIILKATAKNPEERYASMRDLRRDLLRAVREPNREFVIREAKPPREGEAKQPNRFNSSKANTMKLGIIVVVVLGLLLSIVFIGRSILNNASSGEVRFVPTLTGKTEQEARDAAQRMGFKISIRSRVSAGDLREGIIFNQEPKAGNQGREGDTIYIDVSAGPATFETPDVTDLTFEDAEQLILEWDLEVGNIEYVDSDLPQGYVVRQSPAVGTEVVAGDSVDIWVSGEDTQRLTVPSMTDFTLDVALSSAQAAGFTRILVRQTGEEGAQAGMVLRQTPKSSEYVLQDTAIELWVGSLSNQRYSAETAYNVETALDESALMITLREAGVEYVLYEETVQAGPHTIPLTVTSQEGGEGEIVIYVDGVEIRRETVTFARRK